MIQYPSIPLQIPDLLTVGRTAKVRLSFTNPLAVPLTRCSVSLECAGTIWPVKEKVSDVPPKSGFYQTVILNPRYSAKPGAKTLVGVFSSEEMIDVNGSTKMDVRN